MTKKYSPFRLFFGCTKKPILFNYSTVFPSARSYRTPMVGDAENQVLVVFVVFCYTVFNFFAAWRCQPDDGYGTELIDPFAPRPLWM